MNTFIVLSVLFAVAFAQHHNNHFDNLIHNEVVALIKANAGISIADCTSKCDAMFDLIDAHDETHTDQVCHHACECEINQNCHGHTHPPAPTTQAPAPAHTHPSHPTHPPHHGNHNGN